MAIQIKGNGPSEKTANVDAQGRLSVRATSESLQHYISREFGKAYQTWGTATPINGTTVILHIKNNSTFEDMVISYIRINAIGLSGGAALPNTGNYFEVSLDREYSSGGTEVTPVNMNTGSSALSNVTSYNNGPTLSGTAVVSDRYYPNGTTENVYRKEGVLIIGPGDTIEINYTGDNTSGILYTRVSYTMQDRDL